jgi:NADPH:quinone reductase-like Zn-dependent oxidoreductase
MVREKMKRSSLFFVAPYQVELIEEEIGSPDKNQVLVETFLSAVSPGTEMLFFRNQISQNIKLDSQIDALDKEFVYPFKYGYSTVGKVISVGKAVPSEWLDRLVFFFHPHESHFLEPIENIIPIPDFLTPEEALFLPSMETAITLVMDGQPGIGENIAVFGQGVVGLLTTYLLSLFPLSRLITFDKYPLRRKMSKEFGSHISRDIEELVDVSQEDDLTSDWADLSYELSGNPEALNQAILSTRYGGKVIVGSWYGNKDVSLNLGAKFHRDRIRIISSQVSTIAPRFSGRWDKSRRITLAWEMIQKLKPTKLITHRFPFEKVQQAYTLLDQKPEKTIQIIFTY